MLLAVAFLVAPDVTVVTTAARAATSKSATMLRLFIWMPPRSGGPAPHNRGRRRAFGTDQLPLRGMVAQRSPKSQYQFRTDRGRSAPEAAAACRRRRSR